MCGLDKAGSDLVVGSGVGGAASENGLDISPSQLDGTFLGVSLSGGTIPAGFSLLTSK